jgi:hypothetical protein
LIIYIKCDDCPVRLKASEDLLSALRFRRGMSLKEIRNYLFARYGFSFARVNQLIGELKDGEFIEGTARKFTVQGQGGARLV